MTKWLNSAQQGKTDAQLCYSENHDGQYIDLASQKTSTCTVYTPSVCRPHSLRYTCCLPHHYTVPVVRSLSGRIATAELTCRAPRKGEDSHSTLCCLYYRFILLSQQHCLSGLAHDKKQKKNGRVRRTVYWDLNSYWRETTWPLCP